MLNYIMDFIFGGLTGYVTNNIAIKMLFKKYPLLGGGVIADRYEDFITNMSELVERELITHETLRNELNSDKFKTVLRKIIADTIKTELPKASGNISLGALTNIETSFENMNAYIQANLDSFLETVMELIGDSTLAEIISEEQFNFILNHNVKDVLNNLNKYEADIGEIIYNFISPQSVHSLISERTIHKLTKNIIDLINKVEFSYYDDLVNKAYTELIDIIDLDKIIAGIETKLHEMKVADFVNNSNNLSQELFNRVVIFINSQAGFRLIKNLIDNILDELENISMNLSQLLDDDFVNSLENFILTKLPDILSRIIELITVNQDEIESLVNESIDEEFDTGFFSKLIKTIIDFLIDNIAGKFSVVEKIIVSVEEYGRAAPKIITKGLVAYLRNNSISDIIKNLREQKLITSAMLTKLVQDNIRDFDIGKVSFVDEFLDKQIGELFSLDSSFVKEMLNEYFERQKSEFLYSDKFKDSVAKKITEFVEKNKKTNLSQFLSQTDIKMPLNAEYLQEELRKQYPLLNKLVIADFNFTPSIEIDFTKQWHELKQLELNWIYSKMNNEKALTNLEIAIYDLIQNNMKDVLKNRVSDMAKSELSKSSPEEISDMVEEFMGKELKPINLIGAVLGAIMSVGYTGLTAGFSSPLISVYPTILVYGLAGVLTNKIAIWMLFKPYSPWISKLPMISPFVGVVPAQKPIFAENISNFVKTKLLSNDSIIKLYYKERETTIDLLSELIAENNFAVVDFLLEKEILLEKLTGFTFEQLQRLASLNSRQVAVLLSAKIKSYLEESLDDLLPNFNEWVIDKMYSGDYTHKIHNWTKSQLLDRKVGQQNKLIVKLLDNQIDLLFDNIRGKLKYEELIKLTDNHKLKYKNYTVNNSVLDLAGGSLVDNITTKLINLLLSSIDQEKLSKPIINHLKEQQFNPKHKLNELFNGIFADLLTKNVSYLLDIIIAEIETNREVIKSTIEEDMLFFRSKVGPVVDNFIDDKLPQFLRSKEPEILSILLPILDYRLGDIGFTEQTLKFDSLGLNIKEALSNHEVKRSISNVAKKLILNIADIPLDELLQIINISSLNDLLDILSPLLKHLAEQLTNQIESSSEKIATLSKSTVGTIIADISADIYYQDLLKEVNLYKELKSIVALIKSDEVLKNSLTELIKDIVFHLTQGSELYNEEVLVTDIERFINNLLENNLTQLDEQLSPFIREFILNLNSIIDFETKKELLHYLIESASCSLGGNLNEAIDSINVEKIVKEQINNMDPKEIENLFNSFAKDYFNKLIKYGAIGVFPGALVMLAKILFKS